MTATLYALALAVLLPGDPGSDQDNARKPNPFAPSLPLLTDEEEAKLDQIIDGFIQFDTGQLRGEEGKRAKAAFDKLGPETIPALIRGLNRAAAIDHSCPAVVIAKKLATMLTSSRDTELLEFARENAGAGVSRSRHMSIIKDLRVLCMLRKAEVVRRGIEWTPAKKTPRTMTVAELAELVGKERGPMLKEVITELGRRRGDGALAALGAAAADYEGETRDLARTLLNRQLSALKDAALKEKLTDGRAEIRSAAARLVGEKGLRFGGELIELLGDKQVAVRDAAHQALVKLNRGADLGPTGDAGEAEREQAIKKWRAWWSGQQGK